MITPWQTKVILYFSGYIIGGLLGAPIVSVILGLNKIETSGNIGAGTKIGIIERILILTLIYLDNISSISMVFTAKSIIRFSSVRDDQKYAEYYLIGTLSSISYALIIGAIIRYLVSCVQLV